MADSEINHAVTYNDDDYIVGTCVSLPMPKHNEVCLFVERFLCVRLYGRTELCLESSTDSAAAAFILAFVRSLARSFVTCSSCCFSCVACRSACLPTCLPISVYCLEGLIVASRLRGTEPFMTWRRRRRLRPFELSFPENVVAAAAAAAAAVAAAAVTPDAPLAAPGS